MTPNSIWLERWKWGAYILKCAAGIIVHVAPAILTVI